MNKRTIELSGHIIDSLILTKTMAIIMDKGGDFDILEIDVGRKKSDYSKAKIEVSADSPELLNSILDELSVLGASIDEIKEVNLVSSPKIKLLLKVFIHLQTTLLTYSIKETGCLLKTLKWTVL